MTTEKAVAVRFGNLVEKADVERTPQDIIQVASNQATALMEIVEKRKLYQEIEGKKYLEVEAWQTIGVFNRTHAVTDWLRPVERDGEFKGYEAQVSLVKDGETVGSAIMSCGLDEFPCRGKEGEAKHKACKSAAQTWAESKAYRMNFAFVAVLAGFEPTPAEEMIGGATTGEDSAGWLARCLVHDEVWRPGKANPPRFPIPHRWHKNPDGTSCNLNTAIAGEYKEFFGDDNKALNAWLKDNFGKTWSKMEDDEMVMGLKMLQDASNTQGEEVTDQEQPDAS